METPYHLYLNQIHKPWSYLNRNNNRLRSIVVPERKIVFPKETVAERIFHIANFHASQDELQKAKNLVHDRPLTQVSLEHIKIIDQNL